MDYIDIPKYRFSQANLYLIVKYIKRVSAHAKLTLTVVNQRPRCIRIALNGQVSLTIAKSMTIETSQ